MSIFLFIKLLILLDRGNTFNLLIIKIMTKAELIAKIAEDTGVSKKVAWEMINSFTDAVKTAVLDNGEKITLQGFGTFKLSHREARTGVNPQNPSEKIKIPASDRVTFKASKTLRK